MSNQDPDGHRPGIAYTKDCMGATDAQLGNVKPDNTSATDGFTEQRGGAAGEHPGGAA
ncbi:MAG: hypothetical protein ACLR8L_00105 [Oscillospiraceae bacterium]